MKTKIIKSCSILILAIIAIIYAIIKYILSFELYQDQWGTDISFNSDYVVLLLVGICLLIYGMYTYKSYKTDVDPERKICNYLLLTATSLTSFYPLGVTFKAINKGKDFNDYLLYYYIGIIGLFIILYLALNLIRIIKQENKK